jgi:hypothetical protein
MSRREDRYSLNEEELRRCLIITVIMRLERLLR